MSSSAASNNAAGDARSEVARKYALIKYAKERVAALDDPVQPDDEWTDVLKKMRKAGWDTRVPAPLVGGLPAGGANFVFLLPSGKRPRKGGAAGIDYLPNGQAAQEFAREHFGWSDPDNYMDPYNWYNLWPQLKQYGWTYQRGNKGRDSWLYVRPGRNPGSDDARLGIDYFESAIDVIQYCRQADIQEGEADRPSAITNAFDDEASASPKRTTKKKSPIQRNDPWPCVWPKLAASGWTYRAPSGLEIDWTYIRPGKTYENGIEGVDFFRGEIQMKMYLRDKYGWSGAEGDLDVVEAVEAAELEAKRAAAAAAAAEAKRAAAEQKRLEKEAIAEAKRKAVEEQRLANEEAAAKKKAAVSPDSVWDKEAHEEDSPLTCHPQKLGSKRRTPDDMSVEELEALLVHKKRQRQEDIASVEAASRRLPPEIFEGLYKKWKLEQSTIDLTTDNSDLILPDGSGRALQNMVKQRNDISTRLAEVKKEKHEDVEDAEELTKQQTLAADIYQGRVDELGEYALSLGGEPKKINEIRYRPLSSGH